MSGPVVHAKRVRDHQSVDNQRRRGDIERASLVIQSNWRRKRDTRHVELIRIIYEDARKRHRERGVEQGDVTAWRLAQTVCEDIRGATSKAFKCYKALSHMQAGVTRSERNKRVQLKVAALGHVALDRKKMLEAENNWKDLFAAVADSEVLSVISASAAVNVERAVCKIQLAWCMFLVARLRDRRALHIADDPESCSLYLRIDELDRHIQRLQQREERQRSLDAALLRAAKEATAHVAAASVPSAKPPHRRRALAPSVFG
eukprot:CAMPEP_0194545124 /NCGR_PEP_ID=MMETSP0253-20130528/88658_1 /TAXON_ID=2966 /ORGANISM="Noctiluca scintillans" /LENGTH=259 /DNA_ID=CAMNT_0039392093 /DNA_START=62 /DNA_END=838 /DNA_ORIENTATION=+